MQPWFVELVLKSDVNWFWSVCNNYLRQTAIKISIRCSVNSFSFYWLLSLMHSTQGWAATTKHGVLFRKNLQLTGVC